MSAVHCVILSESTRVTDGRMDGQTDRQNYDSQDRLSIAASRGKTPYDVTQFNLTRHRVKFN